MADLTVTASQVLSSTGAVFATGTAGATITAGQPVYYDGTNYQPADANASSTTAAAVGIALHASLTGQPIKIQTAGDITIGAGAAPAVGTIYVVSATAGGIAPSSDGTTGWYTTILGVGAATNIIKLQIYASGQVRP